MNTLDSIRTNKLIAQLGIILNICAVVLNAFAKNLTFGLMGFVGLGICIYTHSHYSRLLEKHKE